MGRRADLRRFYGLMRRLERNSGGRLALGEVERTDCPDRGVYFFFEPGERRSGSGSGERVVRVGSHALRAGQTPPLWSRIAKHKGADSPTGRQRGSVFRSRVGSAICRSIRGLGPRRWPTDAHRGDAARIEGLINERMWPMTMLLLAVGRRMHRDYIERNAIALLSEYRMKNPIDPASDNWLGHYCDREEVRESGLWQNHHVVGNWDPEFFDLLEEYVDRAGDQP